MEVTDSCFQDHLTQNRARNDHKIMKKFPRKSIKKMFKFGQKEVTSKDFYGQRKITDIFTIDVNTLVVSDRVPVNNGKDCRYIAGYQVDEALIPLFIRTPKSCFSYGVLQYDRNSAYTMSLNISKENEWMSQYKKIWNEVESQLFEKLVTEPIKGNNVRGKLKTWKKRYKNKFSWLHRSI